MLTARTALLVVAGLILSGCASSGRSCTDVGGINGVVVDLSPVVRAYGGPLTAEVCVEDACVTQRVSLRRVTEVVAGQDTVDDAEPLEVRVTLTDSGGAVVREATTSVVPRRSMPNGPGCAPTVWNAYLVMGRSGLGTGA